MCVVLVKKVNSVKVFSGKKKSGKAAGDPYTLWSVCADVVVLDADSGCENQVTRTLKVWDDQELVNTIKTLGDIRLRCTREKDQYNKPGSPPVYIVAGLYHDKFSLDKKKTVDVSGDRLGGVSTRRVAVSLAHEMVMAGVNGRVFEDIHSAGSAVIDLAEQYLQFLQGEKND